MNELAKIVQTSGLEKSEGQSIVEKFGDYEQIAKEWEAKAKAIVVTDASQTTEMAMAREARKKFSQLRIDVERSRKAMKEQSLRKGQAIDSIAKFLQSLITPIEEHLRLQEDFIKIQEAQKAEQERIEAEKKAEAERIAKEEAERKEQERIRKENEQLRKEAEEKEKQMQAERAEAQEKQRAIEAKAEAERKVLEEKARKEAEEKEKIRKELEAREEDERKEKERLELERQEALLAPDKEKFEAYINALLNVSVPEIKDEALSSKVTSMRATLANILKGL